VALTALSLVLLAKAVGGAVSYQGDFNGDLYLAGCRILHGASPYQPQILAAEAAIVRAGGTFAATSSPRYPPPLLVVAAPLSLLPLWLADALFMALALACVIWGLRLLGVRDRCCVAADVWPRDRSTSTTFV
jgi:hypothetical protein